MIYGKRREKSMRTEGGEKEVKNTQKGNVKDVKSGSKVIGSRLSAPNGLDDREEKKTSAVEMITDTPKATQIRPPQQSPTSALTTTSTLVTTSTHPAVSGYGARGGIWGRIMGKKVVKAVYGAKKRKSSSAEHTVITPSMAEGQLTKRRKKISSSDDIVQEDVSEDDLEDFLVQGSTMQVSSSTITNDEQILAEIERNEEERERKRKEREEETERKREEAERERKERLQTEKLEKRKRRIALEMEASKKKLIQMRKRKDRKSHHDSNKGEVKIDGSQEDEDAMSIPSHEKLQEMRREGLRGIYSAKRRRLERTKVGKVGGETRGVERSKGTRGDLSLIAYKTSKYIRLTYNFDKLDTS
tara:strand:- start:283 stop:1356 length:1074 start_codon:yes stop_codon:yes gene_type:complete